MGIAKLYSQSGGNGFKINGIIKDYYAYAGENISAGDFVEFINGVASQTTGTSSDTQISSNTYSGYRISATALNENRVFIAHNYGNSSSNYFLYGVVVTIDGATITAGTDTQLSSVAYTGDQVSVVALSENKVFIAHQYGSTSNGSYLYGMVCTINGTTITAGSDKAINGSTTYTGCKISAELVSDNTVFIAHSRNDTYYLYGIVCTINGTSITIGTDTQLYNTGGTAYAISTTKLANNKIFIANSYQSSYYLYAIVCTISGTTITKGTSKALNSSTSYTGEVVSVTALSENAVLVAHNYGSSDSYLYGMVCTISGTTITVGTETALESSTKYSGKKISVLTLSSSKALIVHSSTSSYYLYAMFVSINGTTITKNTDTQLSSIDRSGEVISPLFLSSDILFIAHRYSDVILYGQLFGVNEVNNEISNTVVSTTYETQVRKATTSDIYGVAKSSGIGGNETEHNQKVSIYTLSA